MRKRTLASLLAALMLVGALTACSGNAGNNATGNAATEAPKTEETAAPEQTEAPADETEAPVADTSTLNICLASEPETIDPNLSSASDAASYIQHMFEGLMKYDKNGILVDGYAKEWNASADGLVYTIKLRDDGKWSDGQPVTAKDFVFGWKRLANPTLAAPYAGDMLPYLLNGTEILAGTKQPDELGVKAIDDYTLEVTLANPCGYIKEILGFPVFMPLREDIVKDDLTGEWVLNEANWVNNGAFKMTKWEHDSNITMVPNELYYDAANINQNTLVFRLMDDGNAQVAAIRSGELDLMRSPPSDEIPKLTEEGYFSLSPLLGTYYVSFNVGAKPFDDVRVRKAFSLAIDRKYIVENVTLTNEPVLDCFVGYGFADADTTKEFREVGGSFIPNMNTEAAYEEARQLLADAGYPNGEGFPTVTWLYNTNEGHKRAGEAMQNMWKTVLNVNVELQNADWAVVQDLRRKGDYQFARGGWLGDYNDPMTMLSLFTSTSGNNDPQYKNPAYDKLISDAMATADREEHYRLLHEADKMLHDDAVIAPIYNYVEKLVRTPKLTGDVNNVVGYHFFHWATKAQ